MKNILVALVISFSVFCMTTLSFATGTPDPPDPLCTFKGLGRFPNGDLFTGKVVQAMDGTVSGIWKHRLPTGQVVVAHPDFMFCRPNGSRLVDFSGPANLDGVDGHSFLVSVQDRVDYSNPETQTLTATRSFFPSEWEDGTLTFPGQAGVTIPETLQVVAGHAQHGWARLVFVQAGSEDRIVCRYRAHGHIFRLKRCTGESHGLFPVEIFDLVTVRGMTLHVGHVLPRTPLTVEAEVEVVTPIGGVDTYQIIVFDSTGTQVYSAADDLIGGDTKGDF